VESRSWFKPQRAKIAEPPRLSWPAADGHWKIIVAKLLNRRS